MKVPFEHEDNPGRTVAVRGDFSSWKVSHPLVEWQLGRYRTELDLQPGVYQYKFLIDRQHWVHDSAHPWLDRTVPFNNSTIVVGGSTPPLFFAPCRRCWVLLDGILKVHIEVEAGRHIPERLNLTNEQGALVAVLEPTWLLTVGNRILIRFHGSVPEGAAYADFEGYGYIGRWQLPAPTEEYRPSWLAGAVIYSIFIDRWWRGSHSPPDPRAAPRDTPSTPDTIYGGDIYGVAESLPWIADLGVDAIVLTPIHTAESPHRYDAVCFETVDPRLGGEKALAALLNACHMHGLRLILDAAFTHCHCTNHAFQDMLQNQAQSKYREWFFVNHFPVSISDPDSYRFYPAHPDLPLLNLAAAPVLSFFERLVESWMRLGVDGLRFDAVEFAPPDTWKSLGVCARKVNPDVALIAECVFESPAWAVEQLGVHCATDYTRYELIVKSFMNETDIGDGFRLEDQLLRHRLGPDIEQATLTFVDTHDTDRFLTRVKNIEKYKSALELLLLGEEPALFYYGTELSLTSGKATSRFDMSWPDRLPIPQTLVASDITEWIRQLIKQRKKRQKGPL